MRDVFDEALTFRQFPSPATTGNADCTRLSKGQHPTRQLPISQTENRPSPFVVRQARISLFKQPTRCT
jgi:hypothetical protein